MNDKARKIKKMFCTLREEERRWDHEALYFLVGMGKQCWDLWVCSLGPCLSADSACPSLPLGPLQTGRQPVLGDNLNLMPWGPGMWRPTQDSALGARVALRPREVGKGLHSGQWCLRLAFKVRNNKDMWGPCTFHLLGSSHMARTAGPLPASVVL